MLPIHLREPRDRQPAQPVQRCTHRELAAILIQPVQVAVTRRAAPLHAAAEVRSAEALRHWSTIASLAAAPAVRRIPNDGRIRSIHQPVAVVVCAVANLRPRHTGRVHLGIRLRVLSRVKQLLRVGGRAGIQRRVCIHLGIHANLARRAGVSLHEHLAVKVQCRRAT